MRKLQTNENIDLNYVFLLTEEQAKTVIQSDVVPC